MAKLTGNKIKPKPAKNSPAAGSHAGSSAPAGRNICSPGCNPGLKNNERNSPSPVYLPSGQVPIGEGAACPTTLVRRGGEVPTPRRQPVKLRNPLKRKNQTYPPELMARAKVMFVQEGKSALEIAKLLEGPSHQTISNWAKKRPAVTRSRNAEQCTTWIEEKATFQHNMYANMSPASQAQKILEKINAILGIDGKSFTTKDADALAKLSKLMENITDKKYQVPMMFEILTRLVGFLKTNYATIVNETFLNAVRHFKNDIMNEANQ